MKKVTHDDDECNVLALTFLLGTYTFLNYHRKFKISQVVEDNKNSAALHIIPALIQFENASIDEYSLMSLFIDCELINVNK